MWARGAVGVGGFVGVIPVIRAYVDSVNMRASGEMPAAWSAQCRDWFSGWAKKQYRNVPPYRWTMHGPSRRVVEEVAAAYRQGKMTVRPTRVDLAIDIPCRSWAEADERTAEVAAHVVKFGGEQTRPASIKDQTYYIGQRTGRGVVIAAYGHRPSRFDGTPVCHVEVRLCGKVTLQRHGIRSIEDVARLDPARIAAIINTAIKWRTVDWSRLGRKFNRPRHTLRYTPRTREAIVERACRGEAQRAVRRFGTTWAARRGWLVEMEPPQWWAEAIAAAITSNTSLFDVPAPPGVITCTTPQHPHATAPHHHHRTNQANDEVDHETHPRSKSEGSDSADDARCDGKGRIRGTQSHVRQDGVDVPPMVRSESDGQGVGHSDHRSPARVRVRLNRPRPRLSAAPPTNSPARVRRSGAGEGGIGTPEPRERPTTSPRPPVPVRS